MQKVFDEHATPLSTEYVLGLFVVIVDQHEPAR
jgi:hypothetical protein